MLLGRTGILAAKARVATARASRGGALATADVLDPEGQRGLNPCATSSRSAG